MPMLNAVEIDGCSLVILRLYSGFFANRFEVIASGYLCYDGETLELWKSGEFVMRFNDEQISEMKFVSDENSIAEAAGYQLVIVQCA